MADEGRTALRSKAQPAAWVLDALLGLGVTLIVAVFVAADVGQSEPEGWAYLWAVGLGGLMLVRRLYPVIVVILSVGAVLSYYAADYPPIGLAVPLAAAVFSAAEYGRVTAAVVASATVTVVSVAYRLAVGQNSSFVVGYELPGQALLLAGAIALGDSVRARRELRRQAGEIAELVAERYAREADQRLISERLAIAREVHDSVGHALTVVTLHTQVLEEALSSDDPEVRHSLQAISGTASATLADLRRTVAGLREEMGSSRSPLKVVDLGSAILPAEQAGMEVGTHIDITSDLSPSIEATIYRIVQESITNVVKHAHASHVQVSVQQADGMVSLTVVDDGRGTGEPGPSASSPAGNGIAGMRERTQLLGGTFSASRQEMGFTVRASIPVETKA